MKIIHFFSRPKPLVLGFLYIIFVNAIAFRFFPYLFENTPHFNLSEILDLRFGFSANDVNTIFSNLGQNGLKVYKYSTLTIDMPYAIIYGFIYAGLFNYLLHNSPLKRWIFLPFLISFFDVLENIGVLLLINKFPDIPDGLVKMASMANMLKWIFASATILLLITSLLLKLKKPRF